MEKSKGIMILVFIRLSRKFFQLKFINDTQAGIKR